MNLESKITSELKEAMKAKNSIALEALRAIKSELLLSKTSGDNADFSQDKEIALLQKLVKQRKEAAEQFQQNSRPELAEKELAQADVIQQFLPAQLSEQELTSALEEIITQVGATSAKDMGKVMGIASTQLLGKADGKAISLKVKEILSSL